MRIITCDLISVENGELISGKIKSMGIPVFSIDISYQPFDNLEHPVSQGKHINLNSFNSISNNIVNAHVKMIIYCPSSSMKAIHQVLISQGASSIKIK